MMNINPIFNSWLRETKEGQAAHSNIKTSEDFKNLQNAFNAGMKYELLNQEIKIHIEKYGKDTP